MRDVVEFTLMFIGTCLVAVCNAIWYQGKLALQRKDLPVSFFSNHLRDFRMMDKGISEEMDLNELTRLRAIRRRMRAIWVLFPIGAAIFFMGVFLGPITK